MDVLSNQGTVVSGGAAGVNDFREVGVAGSGFEEPPPAHSPGRITKIPT